MPLDMAPVPNGEIVTFNLSFYNRYPDLFTLKIYILLCIVRYLELLRIPLNTLVVPHNVATISLDILAT